MSREDEIKQEMERILIQIKRDNDTLMSKYLSKLDKLFNLGVEIGRLEKATKQSQNEFCVCKHRKYGHHLIMRTGEYDYCKIDGCDCKKFKLQSQKEPNVHFIKNDLPSLMKVAKDIAKEEVQSKAVFKEINKDE